MVDDESFNVIILIKYRSILLVIMARKEEHSQNGFQEFSRGSSCSCICPSGRNAWYCSLTETAAGQTANEGILSVDRIFLTGMVQLKFSK